MKNVFFSGLATIATLSLIGCGNHIGQSVQQAVVDNQSAGSLIEWEQSPSNPEQLFAQWRQDLSEDPSKKEAMQSELCLDLLSLDTQALTIFENEIRDDRNQELVSACKAELLKKLDRHFDNEKAQLAVKIDPMALKGARSDIYFQPNVQKRDTTNGYFAVSGDVARKEVILTFDDGPSGVYTDSILQSLKAVNAKAIFFMLGKSVRSNPELVKKVAADGHAIGSHSNTHACLGNSSACAKTNGRGYSLADSVAEIRSGHQAIQDVLGWVDPFFRFPYGEASPELKSFLREKSTGEFFWSIDSEDWRAQTNERLLKNTLDQLDARGRGILLFHDIQRRTAEIMPALLRELYYRGYSIVLLQSADESARYNSKLVKKNLP